MARIATYVFLDLETTSIPYQDLNKTRITELSVVAVKRSHILDTRPGTLPRVVNKLTLCVNPGRLIHPDATQASGLDNYLLEHQTSFNIDVFNTFNSLLKCQEKPVCLIAENGYSFDFPILKNHFEKLKVSLSEDVMCADSLNAFYDILKIPERNGSTRQDTADLNATSNKNTEDSERILKDLDDYEFNTQSSIKHINETTPRKQLLKRTTPKRINQVKRKIFYENDPKPIVSYKLKNVYERVLGRPGIEAHRAENDCIMTAEIATAKAQQFVDWVDEHHCPFSEVAAMKLGVPL